METIHFKTVDPVSQDLLRDASQKGIGLNWERYEKQQPQDGFCKDEPYSRQYSRLPERGACCQSRKKIDKLLSEERVVD